MPDSMFDWFGSLFGGGGAAAGGDIFSGGPVLGGADSVGVVPGGEATLGRADPSGLIAHNVGDGGGGDGTLSERLKLAAAAFGPLKGIMDANAQGPAAPASGGAVASRGGPPQELMQLVSELRKRRAQMQMMGLQQGGFTPRGPSAGLLG